MSFDQHIERLEMLDYLIRQEATGTAQELADKLCVSERTIFEDIERLRSWGWPIEYAPFRKTYYYLYSGTSLSFHFHKKNVKFEEE